MPAATGYQTYRNNHFEGMDPNRLILMLYEGAIKHTRLAKEGIKGNNIQKRGEHTGRVIAIVSELNACLDENIKDESIDFLRGLYNAILTELPKVALNNDITILERTESYISKLKDVWENNVMKKPPVKINTSENSIFKEKKKTSVSIPPISNKKTIDYKTYDSGMTMSRKSISA